MESGKDNGAQWGNRLGYMILPFHIAKRDDPLGYVRKAAQVARRKKSSMESAFTFWSGSVVLKIFGIKVLVVLVFLIFLVSFVTWLKVLINRITFHRPQLLYATA
jgi:hypothetical protein